MLLTKLRLIKFVTLVGIGVSLLGFGGVTANASNKGYYGHFDSRRITYHIDSTSKRWQGVWKRAVSQWNNQQNVVKLSKAKKNKADINLKTRVLKDTNQYCSAIHDYIPANNKMDIILHSSMKLNRAFIATYAPSMQNQRRNDMAVLAIGETLGLSYAKTGKTVMNSYHTPNTTITSLDRANLKAAYKGVK